MRSISEPDAKLSKAAQLLEEALRVVITLRVSKGTVPLERVVLERLEKDLQEIRSLLGKLQVQVLKSPVDRRQSWQLIDMLFNKVTEYLFILLKALLFCKLFSLRRVSIYIMRIGQTIKLLRVAGGLKQKELAKRLGISANYLSSVENNKRGPSLALLEALSSELNVPLSFLFLESMDEFINFPKGERKKYQKLKGLLFEIQKLRMNQDRS